MRLKRPSRPGSMCALCLRVFVGPEAGCCVVVTFVEQRVECFEHEGPCFARVWSLIMCRSSLFDGVVT